MEKISVKEIEWKVIISYSIKIYIVNILTILAIISFHKFIVSVNYFDKSQIEVFISNLMYWTFPFIQIVLTIVSSLALTNHMDKGFPLNGFLIGVFVGIFNIAIILIVIQKFNILDIVLLLALTASGFTGGLIEEKLTQRVKKIALFGNKKCTM